LNALSGSADFPLRFRHFPDGLYVVAAGAEYSRAIGARLTGIGGVDVEEVKKRLLPLVLRETDLMAVVQLPGFLSNAQALRGTGILPGTDEGTFHFEKDGSALTLTVRALPVDEEGPLTTSAAVIGYESPLYLTNRQTLYWFRYLPEARTLYIQYNGCKEMKSLSFKEFTTKVMEAADHNAVDKVLLDLRHNGGGNSQEIVPLMSGLKHRSALWRTGHLFVATSPFTFSSGLLNALQLKQQLRAVIVGEPSSQRPNTYGDVRTFQLPNSGATVGYPIKFFKLMHGDPESLQPDITLKLTAHDYFAGRDPVLEFVLGQNSLGQPH
jgi:hypothetical protein